MVVVLMGVSGSGKTTLGVPLSERLGVSFIDADDHHPPENVEKMAAGTPLTDEDRIPWLRKLNSMVREEGRCVLACSALKESYRSIISDGIGEITFLQLAAEKSVIADRLSRRKHRYMNPNLLDSQFETLEELPGTMQIDVSGGVEETISKIAARLNL